MVKQSISLDEAIAKLSDIWAPLNEEQQNFLKEHLTIQSFKKKRIHLFGRRTSESITMLAARKG